MKLKNYKKIILLAAVLGIISFAFIFFYNRGGAISAQKQWEWICQDEEMEVIMQHFEEGEIPIGEAADGTLAMAKEIIRNYDLMLAAGGELAAAAYAVYDLDLPGACRAERCDTDCNVNTYACNSYDCNCIDTCHEECNLVCNTIERCRSSEGECNAAKPPLSECKEQTEIVCVDVETCHSNENDCLNDPSRPAGETCDKVIDEIIGGFIVWKWCFDKEVCDPVSEWCWEEELCDNVCQDVCGPVCDTCWQTCYDCEIDSCGGQPCPQDLLDELTNRSITIGTKATEITGYAASIDFQITQKAPDLRELLRKARLGLKACATPASGYEPSEAVQLIETLVSCREADLGKILSADQDDCYKSNFFCCEPMQ